MYSMYNSWMTPEERNEGSLVRCSLSDKKGTDVDHALPGERDRTGGHDMERRLCQGALDS